MQPRRGCSYGTAFARVNRLVAFVVAAAIFSGNIGRQRNVPQSLDRLEEIRHWLKANAALAKISPPHHLGCEPAFFIVPAHCAIGTKIQPLPDPDLSPRTYQALPFVWYLRNLLGQQGLNPSLQKVSRSQILWTQGIRPRPASPSIEPCRKHARVIEHDQIIGTKQLGKRAETMVFQCAGPSVDAQEARAGTVRQRFLGDQFFWEMIVEVGNEHAALIIENVSPGLCRTCSTAPGTAPTRSKVLAQRTDNSIVPTQDRKKASLAGGFRGRASGFGSRRPVNLLRCQLFQIVLQQADFDPAAAHTLGLCALVVCGGRKRSIAHAENVDPVNRNLVVLNQVADHSVGHLARSGDRSLSLARREALHFDDVSALALQGLGELVDGSLGVGAQNALSRAETDFRLVGGLVLINVADYAFDRGQAVVGL